ncbi:MAG: lipoprotein [Nitratireductor sp.]
MRPANIRQAIFIVLMLATAASVSACGRRGAPEAPPSAAVLTTDETGAAVKQTVDRPFILDGLL